MLVVSTVLAGLALPRSAAAVSASEAIARLNAQRASNGLPSGVVEHPAKTLGCANHLRYQVLNRTGLTHVEVQGRPGWTPEGAKLAPGSGGSEVLGRGDVWDNVREQPWSNAPIHLALTMHPAVRGVGYAHGDGGTCMRMGEAPDEFPVAEVPAQVYSVPGPGVLDVPASWSTSELPYTPAEVLGLTQPTGYNILLWNRVTGEDALASATLLGPLGEVAVRWVDRQTQTPRVTSGEDVWSAGAWNWGTMVLPVRPLAPEQFYTLQVTFLDGTPYQMVFRTAPVMSNLSFGFKAIDRLRQRIRIESDAPVTAAWIIEPSGRRRELALVRRGSTYSGGTIAGTPGSWKVCVRSGGPGTGFFAREGCDTLRVRAFWNVAISKRGRQLTIRAFDYTRGRTAAVSWQRGRYGCRAKLCTVRPSGPVERRTVKLKASVKLQLPAYAGLPRSAIYVRVRVAGGRAYGRRVPELVVKRRFGA